MNPILIHYLFRYLFSWLLHLMKRALGSGVTCGNTTARIGKIQVEEVVYFYFLKMPGSVCIGLYCKIVLSSMNSTYIYKKERAIEQLI